MYHAWPSTNKRCSHFSPSFKVRFMWPREFCEIEERSEDDLSTVLLTQHIFLIIIYIYISKNIALNHPYHKPPRPINLRRGLCRATLQVLRLEPGGLLTAGLPCCSFVFLNRSTSKRSRSRPLGDSKKEYIYLANMPLGLIDTYIYI